jgi:hypothetical protein
MSTQQRKRGANAARKEVDLTEMVKSGAHGAYEALQLYRSRAMRYKSKNDFDEAINVLSNGTTVLLENGYDNAGAELGDLFISLLTELNTPFSDEIRDKIVMVDNKFEDLSARISASSQQNDKSKNNDEKKDQQSTTVVHRVDFLKACIKWSIAVGSRELGDSKLHTRLAECLFLASSDKTIDKTMAYHYAAGEAPLLLSQRIFEGSQSSKSGQSDMMNRSQQLTLGVVNFLSLENLRDANELMFAYRKAEGKNLKENELPPLTQFCDYLLQTCRRDAAPLFKTLVNTYASMLDFDESVPTQLMGPIAVRFFGIKPKVNPMMSILQTMMS